MLCCALLRSFPHYALLCSAMRCYVLSRTALLRSATLCRAVLRSSSLYALICSAMLRYALISPAMLCYSSALSVSGLLPSPSLYGLLCSAMLYHSLSRTALLCSTTFWFVLLRACSLYALLFSDVLCYDLLGPATAGHALLYSALARSAVLC